MDLYNFVERLRWIRETMHNLHDVEYTDYVDQDEDEDDDIKIERQSPLELLKAEFINPICGLMNDFVGFMGMIEKVVDLAAVEEHRYCINLTFDKMLEKLHRKQEAVKAKMERIRNEVANDKDFGRKDAEKLKLQEHKRLGWALRLPKGSAKVVRTKKGKKKKYEILLELTACIWFLPVGSDLSLRAKEHSAYQKQFNLRQNVCDILSLFPLCSPFYLLLCSPDHRGQNIGDRKNVHSGNPQCDPIVLRNGRPFVVECGG